MYAYAEKNPGAKFRRARNGYIYHFNELSELICGGIGAVSVPQLNEEWELVREPVDFLTAINSGKNIRAHTEGGFAHPEWWLLGGRLTLELINNKWYIE